MRAAVCCTYSWGLSWLNSIQGWLRIWEGVLKLFPGGDSSLRVPHPAQFCAITLQYANRTFYKAACPPGRDWTKNEHQLTANLVLFSKIFPIKWHFLFWIINNKKGPLPKLPAILGVLFLIAIVRVSEPFECLDWSMRRMIWSIEYTCKCLNVVANHGNHTEMYAAAWCMVIYKQCYSLFSSEAHTCTVLRFGARLYLARRSLPGIMLTLAFSSLS